MLSSERYLVQKILQHRINPKIKIPPEARMTMREVLMVVLRLLLMLLRITNIGVSIYLARASKMSTLEARMFLGTVLLYWETSDLMLSRASTMPVFTPFCKI
jgi:hypothetical protein